LFYISFLYTLCSSSVVVLTHTFGGILVIPFYNRECYFSLMMDIP